MFYLGKRSKQRLEGVNLKGVKVVNRAIQITEIDFAVLEGVRLADRQLKLWKAKASKFNGIPKGERRNGIQGTGISEHQIGNAVDLGAYIGGSIRWDWNLYYPIALAMRKASIEFDIYTTWGGVWDTPLNLLSEDLEEEMRLYSLRRRRLGKKPFHDGPHFQFD